jgi:hypothetical protein
MSSVELVELINSMREPGKAELRHDNFMTKIERHPGIHSPKFLGEYKDSTGRRLKCYYLPKRECELMVMSESLEVQTKVYDRLAALEVGTAPKLKRASVDPALSALRQAKALETAAKVASGICDRFPLLGESAQQGIFAKIVNPVAGSDVIPLPALEGKTFSASEAGAKLGVSANRIGRLATEHGLKTPEYGVFVLDKSRSSEKQVESFRYNERGLARLAALVLGAPRALPSPGQGDLLGGQA